MNTDKITAADLERYRKTHDLSQVAIGELLGVSGPTVNRWESGQDIPGPAQLLLGMLIHGTQPFGEPEDTSAEEAKHFWQLKLTLADWHKLEALATAGGFGTVRDYLLSLIQEHLGGEKKSEKLKAEMGKAESRVEAREKDLAMVAETVTPLVTEERQAVVYETPKRGRKAE